MHNRGSIPRFPFVSGAERVTGEEREPSELAPGRKSLSCRLCFTVASRKNERGEEALALSLLVWFANRATVAEFRGRFGLACQFPLHKSGPKSGLRADTDLELSEFCLTLRWLRKCEELSDPDVSSVLIDD